MSIHTASLHWTRADAVFTDGKYPRAHTIRFDGGETLTGSPAPDVVRPPLSDPNGTDPEEMLVAAVASCHMLFFLDFARRAGFTLDSYSDAAEGTLGKDEAGIARMTEIRLKPSIMWSGEVLPSAADIALLHHKAHEACFIGQSLKCQVVVL
ncbi:MAG: OsmC family protein [Hyphomonadaceae bacterium]|jgi:organic hydroperoxide reductase OsmC/OhrA|nr:OsmC family protein [Hyphomonadaceae bacterium]